MNDSIKVPGWFWGVSILFLLWNIMGVLSFVGHAFISEETLAAMTESERQLFDSYPIWIYVAFALAVLGGFIGCVGLLLRKKWSKMTFTISLIAIIIQMGYNTFFTKTIEVYGMTQALTMPILIVVFGIFLLWFSNFCIKKGWIS